MAHPASFAAPLLGCGIVQIICGVAGCLTDAIGAAAGSHTLITLIVSILLAVFFVITGCITVAAGCASRRGSNNVRCLSIASLVLNILSILASFGLVVLGSIGLAAVIAFLRHHSDAGYAHTIGFPLLGMAGADLAFVGIMFITSVVACVFSSKARSTTRTGNQQYHVAHVAQSGAVSIAQQPYGGYPQAPPAYPTGQPASYPAPHGQHKV